MTDTHEIIAELIEAGDHLVESVPREITSNASFNNAIMRWSAAKTNAEFPRCTNCGVPLYARQHHLPETLGRCEIITDET